jgi:hypothetical protein
MFAQLISKRDYRGLARGHAQLLPTQGVSEARVLAGWSRVMTPSADGPRCELLASSLVTALQGDDRIGREGVSEHASFFP